MARYGLIGSPVSHSISPELMANLGIPYEAREVRPEELPAFMSKEALDFSGLNITTPLKEAIVPFLVSLSPEARKIGAVNCSVRHGHLWEGHNTDHIGVSFALRYLGLRPKSALIVGTGPAARAAAFALSSKGIRFLFLSRKPGPRRIAWKDIGPASLKPFDLIIGAAPPGTLSLLSEFLEPHNFVLDMNYGERSEKLPVPGFSNGIPILLGQAAASVALWFGGEFNDWAERLVSSAKHMGIL
ncbi:MAG: hypothetical protein ABIM74_03300 [candidate division WOR-3 bacterium]